MAPFDSAARKQAPAELAFRAPPHNIEAEQALLGAILVNNEAFYRVSDFLEPKHFFEPIHQRLFELAGGLVRANKLATPVTLKTFLPPDFDIGNAKGLGMRILKSLVKQLNGTLAFRPQNPGTEFTLDFPI